MDLELKKEEYPDGFGFRINCKSWRNHDTLFFFSYYEEEWLVFHEEVVQESWEEILEFISQQEDIPEPDQLISKIVEYV